MTFSVALTGDSIINRRVSTCADAGFRQLAERIREASVGITHLETLIHDFDEPGGYPAAEAGGTWMRSPSYVADELKWAGFDAVSHASNHALDYGYGALRSTWAAMEAVEMPIAGTGATLADARAPAYVDTPQGRIALVSMTTSFTRWSRAGARRPDMGGRPGNNPLRYQYAVPPETCAHITDLAASLGLWVIELEPDVWAIHLPGLHNSITRFRVADVDRPQMVVDDRDRTGNLRSIEDASRQADFVIAHIHSHEWDPTGDLADTPAFIEEFARDAVDYGADIVLNQGSHAPLRGIELHNGAPIFYDPGDFMLMNRSGISLPMDFYRRFEHTLDTNVWEANPSTAQAARPSAYKNATNPPGGYQSVGIDGFVVPVCSFDETFGLEEITLYPGDLMAEPVGHAGIPTTVSGETAARILAFVRERSQRYGTDIDIAEGHGKITM